MTGSSTHHGWGEIQNPVITCDDARIQRNEIKLDSGSYMVICTPTECFSPLIFGTEPMDDL